MRFNEVKATQAAARLLRNRGGRMSYMKLIKLLYLADREALSRWGRPITTDKYVSMDKGPVLSRVLDGSTKSRHRTIQISGRSTSNTLEIIVFRWARIRGTGSCRKQKTNYWMKSSRNSAT